jgi:hypothetical protein
MLYLAEYHHVQRRALQLTVQLPRIADGRHALAAALACWHRRRRRRPQASRMIAWSRSLNDDFMNEQTHRMNNVMYILTMVTT